MTDVRDAEQKRSFSWKTLKSAAAYSAAGWGRPIVTHDASATAGNHRTKAA